MVPATGMIAELAKAFETANVEMFAVQLPEARIVEVTAAVLRKWNASREEIVGRQLVKFGTGSLSARYLANDTEPGGERKVEISYIPPLGTTRTIRFSQQTWSDGA